MRSFRLTHLVTICAALALLATQNHQSTARFTSDRARYHGSGLDAHGGIEGILVDAFAYTPFAGRDLDMPKAATFVVNYSGFTPEAQAAFQRAVDIWAAILSSPVTIHVDASFVNLSGGTLGLAGANLCGATLLARRFRTRGFQTRWPIAWQASIWGRRSDRTSSRSLIVRPPRRGTSVWTRSPPQARLIS